MNYPKITIVTPSYNQAQFLEATILSVLGQYYDNLEYMILDGGSTDNSKEIILKYKEKLAFWCSEKDNGQAAAINRGFSMATGDILIWLNSDDLLMPNILNKIAEKYNENSNLLYFGNCLHFKNNKINGLSANGSNVVKAFNNNKLNEIDFIIQPSSFWSKSIWDKVGKLNENIHFAFDWEWFLRAEQQFSLQPIDECISMYRIHDDHKSGTGGKKRQEEILRVYQKYNPKMAALYALLMDEKFNFNNKLVNIFFRILNYFVKKNNYILKIKVLKYKKYKKYSFTEIENLIKML